MSGSTFRCLLLPALLTLMTYSPYSASEEAQPPSTDEGSSEAEESDEMHVVFEIGNEEEYRLALRRINEFQNNTHGPERVTLRLSRGLTLNTMHRTQGMVFRWLPIGFGRPLDIHLDGGGAVLERTSIRITGRNVQVTDLTLRYSHVGVAMEIRATESVLLRDVTVRDVRAERCSRERGQDRSAGIAIEGYGPAVRVVGERVVLLDVATVPLYVGAQVRNRISEVLWSDGRFGGCDAPEVRLMGVGVFQAPGTLRIGEGPSIYGPSRFGSLEEATEEGLLERWRAEAP